MRNHPGNWTVALAALIVAATAGRPAAQAQAAQAQAAQAQTVQGTRLEIAHGLEMAISGSELLTIAQLQGQQKMKLQEKARKSFEDGSKLLDDAHSFVEANPGDSPTQRFYTAVTHYSQTLIDHLKNPPSDPTIAAEIDHAVKEVLSAHKLRKEVAALTGDAAQKLEEHASKMESTGQKTLSDLHSKVKDGTPLHTQLTQAEEVVRAIMDLG